VGYWEGSKAVVGGGNGRFICTPSFFLFLSAFTGGSCSHMSGTLFTLYSCCLVQTLNAGLKLESLNV
jgi:hypothetical protein